MVEKITNNLKVIKRNGRKVDFDSTKIVVAIKKGFDSVTLVNTNDEQITKYNEKDMQKVYQKVLATIEIDYANDERIQIEAIQDIIEQVLQEQGYQDVYKSFSEYRERRNQSRKLFMDDKQKHKFLKTLEDLSLKNNNEEDNNISNNNTAMSLMFQYGSTIAKEFAKAYLIKKKFYEAHEEGYIFIHDLEFLAMGTTSSTYIDLEKLFKGGFVVGSGYFREPNDIMTYAALSTIAIQANQNDQHGEQIIPAFDYYLAPGVLKTYRKQLRETLRDLLDLAGMNEFVGPKMLERELKNLKTINIDFTYFAKFYKNNDVLKKIFILALDKTKQKVSRLTYQAMEAFIHNLNALDCNTRSQKTSATICFGTDSSSEGRLVIKSFINAYEAGLGYGLKVQLPVPVFKIKAGINANPQDPNNDLLKLAMQLLTEKNPINFAFLDAPYNKVNSSDYRQEVGYSVKQNRILENIIDPDKAIAVGRGNLAKTSINLVRLAIKHGLTNEPANIEGFYTELADTIELVKDQLLERFEIQCNKKSINFPFLLGEQMWLDADHLKVSDKLRKTLKHGTLAIGFVGLSECLTALIGHHHGESDVAQKMGLEIIAFMRQKCDEYTTRYQLNFVLAASSINEIGYHFISIDKALYGKIKGVTAQDNYTSSFILPEDFNVSPKAKITKEAPYHQLTNGGHGINIGFHNPKETDLAALDKLINMMQQSGIGYCSLTQPSNQPIIKISK